MQSHIIFMLIEVFKNSARATIEHQGRVSENLSPVQLSVFQTEPGVVQIKVKDEGGGIPLDLTDSIFDYGFSTFVPSTNDDTLDTLVDSGLPIGVTARPIDGEGFGLPMTRQYARFFGGDLQILVTQGFGTEVHIRLQEPRAISLESID
jgi:pyruvate dehydrogenase kinase 2/3/4